MHNSSSLKWTSYDTWCPFDGSCKKTVPLLSLQKSVVCRDNLCTCACTLSIRACFCHGIKADLYVSSTAVLQLSGSVLHQPEGDMSSVLHRQTQGGKPSLNKSKLARGQTTPKPEQRKSNQFNQTTLKGKSVERHADTHLLLRSWQETMLLCETVHRSLSPGLKAKTNTPAGTFLKHPDPLIALISNSGPDPNVSH